ncbi:MAG: LAGLIDADG family homing endonuclease [Candidatus Paceibacterota bacterium]
MDNKQSKFFNQWTPKMAYVLGFFAADGNLSITKNGGYYISFQSKDKQIINDIKKSIGSLNKISKRTNLLSNGVFYRLQIGSRAIVERLQILGFQTQKTKHLPFPNMEEKMLSHFVRGYFDGDGNIWKGEVHKERKTRHTVLQLAFTSGANNFLEQLQSSINKRLGTKGCIVLSKSRSYSRLQYSTGDALKIYDFMYNDNTSSLYLKRKKKQFNTHIKYMRL